MTYALWRLRDPNHRCKGTDWRFLNELKQELKA